jgi:quercetin dioxygenase-like cupin family protein
MYVQSGSIVIIYGRDEDINNADDRVLMAGESFHIPVGLIHRIIALENSEVFEFSTQHFDEDSYRLEKGD